MSIICVEKASGAMSKYDSFKDMFQGLSEQGLIIESLNDGVIVGKKDKEKIEIEFGEFTVEDTKAKMLTDVIAYRAVLRESITLLKKQGLVEKSQLDKLAAQFQFVKELEEPKKEEVKKEEPKA